MWYDAQIENHDHMSQEQKYLLRVWAREDVKTLILKCKRLCVRFVEMQFSILSHVLGSILVIQNVWIKAVMVLVTIQPVPESLGMCVHEVHAKIHLI